MLKNCILLSCLITTQLYSMSPQQKIRAIIDDETADIFILGTNPDDCLRISLLKKKPSVFNRTPKNKILFQKYDITRSSSSENTRDDAAIVEKITTRLRARLESSDLSLNQKLYFAIALHDAQEVESLLDQGATGNPQEFEHSDAIFGGPYENAAFYAAHLILEHERNPQLDRTACIKILELLSRKDPELAAVQYYGSGPSPLDIVRESHQKFKETNPSEESGYEMCVRAVIESVSARVEAARNQANN